MSNSPCQHEDMGLESLEAMLAAMREQKVPPEMVEAAKERIMAVRTEARDTIIRLEPRHIVGWANLCEILETALMRVRVQRDLSKPGGF